MGLDDLMCCVWMMDILFKLWERICRPLQMSHKLQSSTLGNLAKYSHMGELLAALQGQYHFVEINGKVVPLQKSCMQK